MSQVPHILVVDDEFDLCEIMQFNLEIAGYSVDTVYSAEEALELELAKYDLLLLDVMMDEMSGFELAGHIREQLKLTVPIIFLTAKGGENNLLEGFESGGDDYIEKPYSIKEVLVRVKAMLKRSKADDELDEVFKFNGFIVHFEKKQVFIDDESIKLTRKEFDIISILVENKRKFVNRAQIVKRVWGGDVDVSERNVDVNIARLRKKIGSYGNNIKGRTGYGYIFDF